MILSNLLLQLLYLLAAPAVLALGLPGSSPPTLAARRGPGSTSVTKKFVSKKLDVNLTYVENSGVCETTPGVHQVSGYVTVGKHMHMVRDISVAVCFFFSSPFLHLVVLVLRG